MYTKLGINKLSRDRLTLFLKDVDNIFFLMVMVFSCVLFIDRDTVNLVTFVFLTLALVKIKQNGYIPSKYLYFVFLFIAGILISLLDANHVAVGLDSIRKMMKWIFLPIVILQFNLKQTDKKRIVYTVFLATVVYLVLALAEVFSGAKGRIDAGYNISQYSINLAFMIIIYSSILIWSEGDRIKKNLSIVGLVISILLLGMAGTRGVWISIVICLTTMLLLKKKHTVLCIFLFIVFSGVIGALIGDFGLISNRLKHYESSANARLDIYSESYRLFRKNPINGIGYANFSYEQDINNYRHPKKHAHSHNMILKMACETGLIGLIAYIALKSFIFICLWKNMKDDFFIFVVFNIFLVLELYDLFTINIKKNFSYAVAFFLLGIAFQNIHSKKRSL